MLLFFYYIMLLFGLLLLHLKKALSIRQNMRQDIFISILETGIYQVYVYVFKRTVKFINDWEIAIVLCQLNSNLQMQPSDCCCYKEEWLYPVINPTTECSLIMPAQTPSNELGLSPVSWNRCVQVSSVPLRLIVALLVCLWEYLLTS